ncbi:MAG TPA: hypothetical protein VMT46_07890 [Anaerolineaceae bacterium]|nr:hypothetical protein [Anaerolineaceae bacterium]
MKLLKKDNELNPSDLEQYPVWEFAFREMKEEGLSERTMKPSSQEPPYDPHQSRLLVRTSFHLVDGTVFKGFIKPIDLLNTFMGHLVPIDLFPVIVTEKGHVVFWYGPSKPSEKEISDNYLLLGKESREVFPISFKSDVEIVNGAYEGELDGFLYCEENEVEDFFHMKESEIKSIR